MKVAKDTCLSLGPVFERPERHEVTHKSKEFSTSRKQYGCRTSASEASCNNILFPSTCMYFLKLLYGNFTYLLLTMQ